MAFETVDIKSDEGVQEIKISGQMKIDDDKAYLKKVGNVLYIIPFHDPYQNMMKSLEIFTPDFMETRNQRGSQQKEPFD